MYYESRQHTSVPVADAAEAVHLIHTRQAVDSHCPTWTNNHGHRIALVDDSHIDAPWLEVAVINLDTKEQYESITFGWCPTEAEKLGHVVECECGTTFARPATLPIEGQGEDRTCRFTCGCCGESFRSTLTLQKKFDQDAGYGICPNCEKYYPESND